MPTKSTDSFSKMFWNLNNGKTQKKSKSELGRADSDLQCVSRTLTYCGYFFRAHPWMNSIWCKNDVEILPVPVIFLGR
jgi:hypothetical protein